MYSSEVYVVTTNQVLLVQIDNVLPKDTQDQ